MSFFRTGKGGSKVLFEQGIAVPEKIATDGMPKKAMISLNLSTYLETEIWTDADPTHTTLYYNGGSPSTRSVGASNSFFAQVDATGITITNSPGGSNFNYMVEV